MTYKKVTPISKGVLRIRSEPDESGRVCGSVSYGEEVTVETTKVTSKKGKEYYRLAGYGYILASQVRMQNRRQRQRRKWMQRSRKRNQQRAKQNRQQRRVTA